MTLKLQGDASMNGHVYYKCLTPQGRMVRVGDQYLNAQGVWLQISRIFKPQDSADIQVEFTPVDPALEGRCWQGEFLVACNSQGADETNSWPCVYIEDMDSMTSAEEISAEPDATSADEAEGVQNRDYLIVGMR